MPTDETTTKPADDQIIPLGAWGGLGRGFSKHATALALQRTKGQARPGTRFDAGLVPSPTLPTTVWPISANDFGNTSDLLDEIRQVGQQRFTQVRLLKCQTMLGEGACWRRELAGGGSLLAEGACWGTELAGGGSLLAEGAGWGRRELVRSGSWLRRGDFRGGGTSLRHPLTSAAERSLPPPNAWRPRPESPAAGVGN